MRLDRFTDLLDARGPRVDAWAESERSPAAALLAVCAEARAALATTEALHQALDAPPVEPAAEWLRAAILAAPARYPRPPARSRTERRAGIAPWWLRWLPLAPGVAAAAAVAAGFILGHDGLDGPSWLDPSNEVASLVYGDTGDGEMSR